MCKYDSDQQTIFIVLKPSIQQESFTLHLLAIAEVILYSSIQSFIRHQMK